MTVMLLGLTVLCNRRRNKQGIQGKVSDTLWDRLRRKERFIPSVSESHVSTLVFCCWYRILCCFHFLIESVASLVFPGKLSWCHLILGAERETVLRRERERELGTDCPSCTHTSFVCHNVLSWSSWQSMPTLSLSLYFSSLEADCLMMNSLFSVLSVKLIPLWWTCLIMMTVSYAWRCFCFLFSFTLHVFVTQSYCLLLLSLWVHRLFVYNTHTLHCIFQVYVPDTLITYKKEDSVSWPVS